MGTEPKTKFYIGDKEIGEAQAMSFDLLQPKELTKELTKIATTHLKVTDTDVYNQFRKEAARLLDFVTWTGASIIGYWDSDEVHDLGTHTPFIGVISMNFPEDLDSSDEFMTMVLHELGHGLSELYDTNNYIFNLNMLDFLSGKMDGMLLSTEIEADKIAVYLNRIFHFVPKEYMISKLGEWLDTYAKDVVSEEIENNYGVNAITDMWETPLSSQLSYYLSMSQMVLRYQKNKECLYSLNQLLTINKIDDFDYGLKKRYIHKFDYMRMRYHSAVEYGAVWGDKRTDSFFEKAKNIVESMLNKEENGTEYLSPSFSFSETKVYTIVQQNNQVETKENVLAQIVKENPKFFDFIKWVGGSVYHRQDPQDFNGCHHSLLGIICLKGDLAQQPKSVNVSVILHELGHALDELARGQMLRGTRWNMSQKERLIIVDQELRADKIAVYLNQVFKIIPENALIQALGRALNTYVPFYGVKEPDEYGERAIAEMTEYPFVTQYRYAEKIEKLVVDYNVNKPCLTRLGESNIGTGKEDISRYEPIISFSHRVHSYYFDALQNGEVYGTIRDESFFEKFQ